MTQYYKGCKEKVSGRASSHVHSTPVVNPFVYKVASNSGYCSYQGCYSKGGRASLMVSNIGTPFPNAFCAVANSTFCRAKFRNSPTWSACWKSADRDCWIVGIDIISPTYHLIYLYPGNLFKTYSLIVINF
jgi:hypothetical protein